MLQNLTNNDGSVAPKRAAEDREGHIERISKTCGTAEDYWWWTTKSQPIYSMVNKHMWQISPPHLPRELEQSRLPSAEPLLSVTDRLYSMVYQWLHPAGNSEHYQVEKCTSHPLMPILCSCHLLIDTNTPDHRPKSHKLTNTV